MEVNISLVSFLVFLFAQVSNSLDFEAAFSDGKFEIIEHNKTGMMVVQMSPSKAQRNAFYRDDNFDLYNNGHMGNISNKETYNHNSNKESYELILTTPEKSELEDFTGELSVVVLKLAKDQGDVEVILRRGSAYKSVDNISERTVLPNSTHGILYQHIFKTWTIGKLDSEGSTQGNRSIEIRLTNWSRMSSIYLIATAYSFGPSSSDNCPPSTFWRHSDWWDCRDSDELPKRPLCISYGLTCNNLPNCAQKDIPNLDENCSVHIGVMEVLELIIYTLMAILLLLIVSALAKCFIRRHQIRSPMGRGNIRRHMEIRELFAAAQIVQRPANAPPTYEDAMKFVNDAFDDDDSITEDPPEYSTVPAPGEQTCMSTPASPSGIESPVSFPTAFVSSSSVSPTRFVSSSSSHIAPIFGQIIPEVHPEDGVKQVKLIQGDGNSGILNTAEESINSEGEVTEVGVDGFEDNFIDIPLEELPQDPPAYSYLP